MNDPTDLSKSTSDEIIGKIVDMALGSDGVWADGEIAKLHVLTVVLKQAVIREASVGTFIRACDFPAEDVVYMNDDKALPIADYWLIPKEKPERGKPSQALLDELSEISGGRVEYEPEGKS